MPKQDSSRDYTVEELRRMLVEKRRGIRQERLEHFRRTGRVVTLSSDGDASALGNMRSSAVREMEAEPAPRSPTRRKIDLFLLFVEVAAVMGLVFVLYNGFQLMRNLNQEAVSFLVQPTLTPTPIISAVVLPSGHTPPDSPGGTRLNEAEIPEHLRPLFQSLQNIPLPTPGPQHPNRVQIPAINVDAPVVQGDGWEQLKKGVGQHLGSANPGDDANMVLTAHNDVFGEIFRDLDRLKPGDTVLVHNSEKVFTYVVTGTRIVEPDEVSVLDPGSDAIVTLISCYPYMVDKQRIIVTARLEDGNS